MNKKIPKGPYKAIQSEEEILKFWKENDFFRVEYHPDKGVQTLDELKKDKREAFCLVNPPPNVNGRPHIGHMSGYAYQDLMARYARMQGKKVAMMPGKDHAGIQTEAVFERDVLKPKGKTKLDLGRESFYRATYKFCEKAAKWARADEERIGLSSDFTKDTFTLDPDIVEIVLETFLKMVKDGNVYKGVRIVNWCPSCQTTLADIDTERADRKSKLYYIKYPISNSKTQTPKSKGEKVKILLATKNKDKIKYLKPILEKTSFEVIAPGELREIEEGKESLVENAEKKAIEYSKDFKDMFVISTDGGAKIPYLGDDWNQVMTRRMGGGGEVRTDKERIEALLEMMKDAKGDDRSVSWNEGLAIAKNGELLFSKEFQGDTGILVSEFPGTFKETGFWIGYMWYIKKHDKTYMELTPEEMAHYSSGWYGRLEEEIPMIKQQLMCEAEYIEVATTRPETMLGDSAVVVNPSDKRYKKMFEDGVKVVVPLVDREVPIITSRRVKMEFGTGAVKLTPAHSPDDYTMMEEWNKEVRRKSKGKDKGKDKGRKREEVGYINVIYKDGKMTGPIGKYKGMSVEEARAEVLKDLDALGLLVKEEDWDQNTSTCERCKSVIEPMMSSQWYVDVEKLKQPAIDAVREGKVKIHPKYMEKRYLYWMENLREWPISRSLWWGYRFPVWYKGGNSEWVDDEGIVRQKIGDYKVKDTDNLRGLIKKGLIYTGLDNPNLPTLFVVPGKHGYLHRKISNEIISLYGSGKKVLVNNIDNPSYKDYQNEFIKLELNTDSIVVAHSLGGRAMIKYILENNIQVGQLILIAPPIKPRDEDKTAPYAVLWENEKDYTKLDKLVGQTTIICSDNDELATKEMFEEFSKLFTKVEFILEEGKGHFATVDYDYIPVALEEIFDEVKKHSKNEWIQDENIFDTWFSSGQWAYAPLIKHNLLDIFYPTSTMETMFDILELWVSRMIMLGIYHEGDIPFSDVYLHGMVLAPDGQKMSKSKGNQITPDEIIGKYGADVLRMFYYTRGKAGGQYAIDYDNMTGNGKFLNKLWNSAKFVMMNLEDLGKPDMDFSAVGSRPTFAGKHALNLQLNADDEKMLKLLESLSRDTYHRIQKFNFPIACSELYESYWHEFCDIYLEKVKTRLYTKDRDGNPLDYDKEDRAAAQWMIYHVQDTYLKLLHPFIPFITERIWRLMGDFVNEDRKDKSIVWEKFNY